MVEGDDIERSCLQTEGTKGQEEVTEVITKQRRKSINTDRKWEFL